MSFALFALMPALAQETDERPIGPKGVPAGSFRAFPVAYAGIFYDDNVYRTQAGTVSDLVILSGASLALRSEWGRHMLNFTAAADNFLYQEQTNENRTQWNVGADGRLDILRGFTLTAGGSYGVQFEPRNSPNEIGAIAEPAEYSVAHLAAALRYQPNRFGVEVGIALDDYDFRNTPLVGGGVVDNSDRDLQQTVTHAEVSYAFPTGHSVFLRGSYDVREYDSPVDRFGLRRDSDGYAVDVGMDIALTRLLEGEIFVGYIEHDYTPPLPNVSGFNYGASLRWIPTPLLTVTLTGSRRLAPTVFAGAAASDDSRLGVIFDYEFLRNVLARATLDMQWSSFPGTSREDELFAAGFGLRYLVNDNLTAEARYEFATRDSSVLGEDFDANSLFANLRVHF